jgi:RNA polymerase sigma-70 factor (ECF subfamily)
MNTNANLLKQAKSGDGDAFNKLVEESLPRFKASIQNKYHIQACDMDDIIQAAMITAWTNLHSFRGEAAFSTWFYAIIRNETLDFLKRENKRLKHEVSAHDEHPDFDEHEDYCHLFKDMVDKELSESAITLIEQQEKIKAYRVVLEHVLSKLSGPHQEILKLVLKEDLTYREIASTLGIPVGTVMSRLFLARRQAR